MELIQNEIRVVVIYTDPEFIMEHWKLTNS